MMKNFFDTEWAKLREMTFTQKRQYIWEYYKLQFFIFIFVVGLVIYALNVWVINPRKSEYLYIAWLGDVVWHSQLQELGEELSVIVGDPEREAVYLLSYAATGNVQMDRHTHARFMGNLQMGSIDIFLTSHQGIQELEYVGYLRNLAGVLDYIIVAPERFVFCEDGEVIAVSLAGSLLIESVEIDASDLYLAMVITSQRHYEISKALEVLLR